MSSEKIPENELAQFIVKVRMLASRDVSSPHEAQRTLKKIKNMVNKIFRDYVGYTPDGAYRIKAKDERCFKDAIEALGGSDEALAEHAEKNPVLRKILRGDVVDELQELGGEDRPPLHLVQRMPQAKVEWAEDFDPEAPARTPVARTPELVDLDDLGEVEDLLVVEPIRVETED